MCPLPFLLDRTHEYWHPPCHDNFQMLSRLNKLDLCGLFKENNSLGWVRRAPGPCFCPPILVSWHLRRPSFLFLFPSSAFPEILSKSCLAEILSRRNLVSPKSCLAKILSCFCISCNFLFFFCFFYIFPVFLFFSPSFVLFLLKNYVSCFVLFCIYTNLLSQILTCFPFFAHFRLKFRLISHFSFHFLSRLVFKKIVSPTPRFGHH